MRAVAFRVCGTLQRRWLSAVVVAGIVAIASGSVLTLAAGARRTAAAPDAYTAAVGGDPDASVTQEGGPPRSAEVAALPVVESAEAATFLFAAVRDPDHESVGDTIAFAGSRLSTSRLVAGRAADPTAREEFVANQLFVADHDARLGQHFPLVSWTADQVASGKFFDDNPQGPTVDGVLVGVLDSPGALEAANSSAFFSSALLDEEFVLGRTLIAVRLRPGTTTNELRSQLDSLPGGDELGVEPGHIIIPAVRTAVDAQARGLWLMAAAAAIAVLVALGQLLTRHARLAAAERRPLTALGFTSGQLAAETMSRAAFPAAVGVAVGTVFAIAASGLFPAGFVRRIDPYPGPRADVAVLAVGGGLLLLGLLTWVGVALVIARPTRAARTPSPAIVTLAARAPSPAAATGTRFALTGHERSSASAIGTLVALGLIVAGIVAATAFAASLHRLVSDRDRFGGNYSFGIGDLTDMSAGELRGVFEGDPDIEGLMILSAGQARAGGTTIGLVGVERVQGGLAPRVLAGRLPASPDELALGRATARQLRLHLGEELDLAGVGGGGVYRVVGLAVVPGLGSNDGVGQGGVVTPEGLRRLEPSPEINLAAIELRRDAPADAGTRLAALVSTQPGEQDVPSAIDNVARVQRIPGLLAALLVVMALLTMAHALVVSIQSRRRDLAVLRALGADGRWIGRTVHWQATVLAFAPLVLGVPFGLLAGSIVFRAFADRIGALSDPALPIVLVVGLMVGLIGVANLVAVVPARRARLDPAAQLLQVE